MFLGVNTSLSQGQICLKGPAFFKDIVWEKKGSHSERITDNFNSLLNKNLISLNDIKKIFCAVGPGSFTGIRVGVNFCKTLAYTLNVPIVPVSTLELLALNCENSDLPIVSTIDAQKNSFYISEYLRESNKYKILQSHAIYSTHNLKELFNKKKYICGDGFDKIIPFLDEEIKENMIFSSRTSNTDFKKYFNYPENTRAEGKPWHEVQPLYLKLSAPEEKLILSESR